MGLSAYTIASQNGRPQLPVTAKVMACLISLVLVLYFWDAHGMSQLTPVPNLTLCPKSHVCFQALAVGTLPVLELMLEIQSED